MQTSSGSNEPAVRAPGGALRILVSLSLGLAFGIFGFAIGAGVAGSMPAAWVISGASAGLGGLWAWKRLSKELDEGACSRGLKILSSVATLVAVVQIGRLTVFMVSASHVGYSSVPSSPWETRHSCLSAYYVAAEAADKVPNLYASTLYSMPDDDPTKIREARTIGPFGVDVFEYPPTFLLLPRALRPLAPDFMRFRSLWFGLNGAVVLLSMLLVARAMGRAAGTRALLLSPLVWAALPTLSTLQKGNVQAMVIAISIAAMVLLEKKRVALCASGGALLAFAIVSKLYPGLLVLYFFAKRQWRALAWTTAMGFVFALLTLWDLGWASYQAFLTHLPGLLGGEAFPAFRNPNALAINYSIPGLVFKLKLFGVPGMGFAASKILGWLYTIVAVWATVAVSLRALRDEQKPAIWMAILIIATLRSPFLPQAYAAFPPLWLLTLLAAAFVPNAKTLTWTVVTWLALNVFWPMDWPIDPRVLAVVTLLPQTATIGLAILAIRRREPMSAEMSEMQAA